MRMAQEGGMSEVKSAALPNSALTRPMGGKVNMYDKPAPSLNMLPTSDMAEGVPVMHQGGTVQKDGLAMLQKGETVVPAKKSPMTKDEGHKKEMKAKSGKKHNGFKKTIIHHHTDGTHSVEHEHENHPKNSVSGTHADLSGVHDSLEANIGAGSQAAPDMPQAQPQMADAGAAAAPAPAAASPAPAAAAPAPAMA